jgi:heme exporter protein B
MKTPYLRTLWAVVAKDLRIELRSRELIGTMLLFALLSLLIFSFALELNRIAREEAITGVLWVTIIFASTLGLNRSMAMEREQGNMDAMLIAPIPRTAIFAGKFLGNFVFSLTVGLLLLVLMTVVFNKTLLTGWILVVLVLGTFGLSTIGTLISAMTVQTRAREALLPIAMLPIVIPLLLGVVRATTAILAGNPIEGWIAWPQIILFTDALYLGMALATFGFIVED